MADRYWVGGSGTWNWANTAPWSSNSGGGGGASVPTWEDRVFFNDASDTGTSFTVTISAGNIICGDITVSSLDQAMTLSGGGTLNIYGNLTYPSANLTATAITHIFQSNTAATKSITTNNTNLGSIDFRGIGSNYGLGSDFSTPSNGFIAIYAGNVVTNNYNITTGYVTIQSNTNARGMTLGSSTITLTNSTSGWNITNNTNVFFYANTSTILSTRFSTGFVGGSQTYNNVIFAGTGTNNMLIQGNPTIANLTIDGNIASNTVSLSSGTLTVTNQINLNGGNLNVGVLNANTASFISSGSKTRVLAFNVNGDLNITGDAFTVSGSNFSVISPAGMGNINMTSSSTKTFTGGGFTYPVLNQQSTGTLIIADSNTFANIKNTDKRASNIAFTAGTTTTVSNFGAGGTAGNILTLTRSGSVGTYSLVKTGGGTINADYVNVQYSIASPESTWYAGANSTDLGDNTGWIFANVADASGNFLMFM